MRLALLLFAAALARGGSPSATQETGASGAAELTQLLLEKKDEADPAQVRRLANLKTVEALDGLCRFYDAIGSLHMRRIALQGFGLFEGVTDAEQRALQKLTDIATQSQETELRETAVDVLGGCAAGRPYLASIVASNADDALRELALRTHVAGARPEDGEWYQRIFAGSEGRNEGKKKRDKDDATAEIQYTAPLRELAFSGLVTARSSAELVEASESRLVGVRRLALEELSTRSDPQAESCAQRLFESRAERPDIRLLAARILLEARGPKYAERLFKEAKRPGMPQELAFGLADLLIALDDPGLRNQAVKGLGDGQSLEKRFHLRMAAAVPDPKVDKALLALSRDEDASVAADALAAMGRRGNPTFVPRLRDVLRESTEPAMLQAAFEALNRLQASDPAWRAELGRLASHPLEVLRNAALVALGRTRDAGQLASLELALAHPSWSTRLAAARGLEELRVSAGVGALCRRIGLENGRMRAELAEILWHLTGQPFRSDARAWESWWKDEGASFRLPTPDEVLARQRERELREERQVTRSFRGVKVDSRFFGLRILSQHVAFVVDVSGSMEERLPGRARAEDQARTRMAVARTEILACLEALEAGTHFNIVSFAQGVTSWKKSAVECTEESYKEAAEYVAGLAALGGTNLYGGLIQALEDPEVDTLFLLSDGEPSVGERTDPAEIREHIRALNQERRVVIHTVAIGDRFPLLEWLAVDSGGRYRTYP